MAATSVIIAGALHVHLLTFEIGNATAPPPSPSGLIRGSPLFGMPGRRLVYDTDFRRLHCAAILCRPNNSNHVCHRKIIFGAVRKTRAWPVGSDFRRSTAALITLPPVGRAVVNPPPRCTNLRPCVGASGDVDRGVGIPPRNRAVHISSPSFAAFAPLLARPLARSLTHSPSARLRGSEQRDPADFDLAVAACRRRRPRPSAAVCALDEF